MLEEQHEWELKFAVNVNFNVTIVEFVVVDIFISQSQNYPNWGNIKNLFH